MVVNIERRNKTQIDESGVTLGQLLEMSSEEVRKHIEGRGKLYDETKRLVHQKCQERIWSPEDFANDFAIAHFVKTGDVDVADANYHYALKLFEAGVFEAYNPVEDEKYR